MPNYCNYKMKVTGKASNIKEFIEIIQRKNHEEGRHLHMVFLANVEEQTIEDGFVYIVGNCAWSVRVCMMEGTHTYFNNSSPNATSLTRESERLTLTIEVYSEEPGNCFEEHYVIVNGEVIVSENVKMTAYCTDKFDTVEEMNKKYNTHFTNEEFELSNYIKKGGFGDWKFDNFEVLCKTN